MAVRLGVYRDGARVATMNPGFDFYAASQQRSSTIAIESGPPRDLYAVLEGVEPSGVARVSVFINPLVMWIWISWAIMATGALVAV